MKEAEAPAQALMAAANALPAQVQDAARAQARGRFAQAVPLLRRATEICTGAMPAVPCHWPSFAPCLCLCGYVSRAQRASALCAWVLQAHPLAQHARTELAGAQARAGDLAACAKTLSLLAQDSTIAQEAPLTSSSYSCSLATCHLLLGRPMDAVKVKAPARRHASPGLV